MMVAVFAQVAARCGVYWSGVVRSVAANLDYWIRMPDVVESYCGFCIIITFPAVVFALGDVLRHIPPHGVRCR